MSFLDMDNDFSTITELSHSVTDLFCARNATQFNFVVRIILRLDSHYNCCLFVSAVGPQSDFIIVICR